MCVCACACGGGEQFFSRQLLFGRFDNDEPVMASLYPAFKEYLDYYNGVIKVLAYMGPALNYMGPARTHSHVGDCLVIVWAHRESVLFKQLVLDSVTSTRQCG